MLSSRKSLFFTLFFALTLLIALVPVADADTGANLPAHRRQATRMLKKRAPLPARDTTGGTDNSDNPFGAVGVGADPNKGTSTDSTTSTSGTTTSTDSVGLGGTTTKTTTTSTTSSTSNTDSLTATTNSTTLTSTLLTSTTNSTTSTSTSTTSSTSSISSTSSSTSTSSTPIITPSTPTDPLPQNTLTITTPLAASDSPTSAPTPQGATGIGKTTLTIIIVIASCVGGAIIIWTIIRKWKFRPSAEFEDRMQPIDWEPTVDHNSRDDGDIPGLRRVASNASHGSFHSGSDHGLGGGRGYGGYGATSDHGHGLISDLPQHDFTAAPTHLAPVGGYADLARGPSPQPQMSETRSRGFGYDTYGPRY